MAMAVASVSAPRDKVSVAIARVQGAQLLSVAVGPLVGGVAASHLGIRPAFYVTSVMCAIALGALLVLFRETEAPEPGETRGRARMPFRAFLRYRHFVPVMGLLLVAQFIDRALGLLIPLQVAHMPGIQAEAATSGLIISVAAVGAAVAANVAARMAQAIPVGRLLLAQLAAGGVLCAAMAAANHWLALLVLRTLVALCLGGALTMAYSLGGMIVPVETRGAAFGWLALGVQIGTAASPLLTGAVAASSLANAYLLNAALALAGAALLVFGARDLLHRLQRSDG
jgi:DHA1 family multidrug resistance protein-like MFS transporter